MFPSLDIDCIFQDLAFQVLKPFGVINFSIRPKEELWFSCLGLPRHDHKKMIVKTWQTNSQNLTLFFFNTWHAKFWNVTLCCKSLFPIIDKLRLGTPSLELFGVNTFNSTSKKKIMSWFSKTWTQVYTSETNCQDLADQILKSITFFGPRFGMPSFEMLHCFANPCSQVLTMIVLFKTWYFKSWSLLG